MKTNLTANRSAYNEFTPLCEKELSECNGGFILIVVSICSLLLAGFGAGYMVGKDAAERTKTAEH